MENNNFKEIIRIGITIFKVFILGGILLDKSSKITFYNSIMKLNFQLFISDNIMFFGISIDFYIGLTKVLVKS